MGKANANSQVRREAIDPLNARVPRVGIDLLNASRLTAKGLLVRKAVLQSRIETNKVERMERPEI
jgi:hypothetical protein